MQNISRFNSGVPEVPLVAPAICGGGEGLGAALDMTRKLLDSAVSILVACMRHVLASCNTQKTKAPKKG